MQGNMEGKMYKGKKGFFVERTRGEIRRVRRPGNALVRDLITDKRFTGFILQLLSSVGVVGLRRVCFSGRAS